MKIEWIDGFTISVGYNGHTVTLSANREGLLSLAKQLMAMANERLARIFIMISSILLKTALLNSL